MTEYPYVCVRATVWSKQQMAHIPQKFEKVFTQDKVFTRDTRMIYIGIDPGLDGALAAIREDGSVIAIEDAPTLTVKGKKNKRHYDVGGMWRNLRIVVVAEGQRGVKIALENVHAMPGQGVSSMFSMGYGLGLWRGIIASLDLPLTMVEPVVWKRQMGLIGKDKAASVVLAQQRFPTADLRRKKDHGRADALLLALYLVEAKGK